MPDYQDIQLGSITSNASYYVSADDCTGLWCGNVEYSFRLLAGAILGLFDWPDRKRTLEPIYGDQTGPNEIVTIVDQIIMDFCDRFGDLELGMAVVRQQFLKTNIDFRTATPEELLLISEKLSGIIGTFQGEKKGIEALKDFKRAIANAGK